MDDDLATWLAGLVALDEADDALLNALAGGRRPRLSSSSPDAREQPLLSVGGWERRADAQQPPAVKLKKRGTWRAKNEIERLRQTVVDLEACIARHARRHPGSPRATSTESQVDMWAGNALWKDVAARQLQRLRTALRDNQRLRARVQCEYARATRLNRLVQLARGRCSNEAIPRNITPVDDRIVSCKRQEVVMAVSIIYQSIRGMLNDCFAGLPVEEFRSTHRLAKLTDPSVPSGAVLVQSKARRLVPVEISQLGEKLWRRLQNKEMDGNRHVLHVQHVERCPEFHLVVESFEVPTEEGVALFHIMGARARFRSDQRDVTVAAGSLWPDVSAPASVLSTTFDLRSWTIARPHGASVAFSDVLFHADVSRALTPNTTHTALTARQARLMDELTTETQTYMLNDYDQLLDAVLLPQQTHYD